MKDVLIVVVSFVVVLFFACLKAKWHQDRGESFTLLPKSRIQRLFDDDSDKN